MYWRKRRVPFTNLWDDLFQEMNEFEEAFSRIWTAAQHDPNAKSWYYGVQISTGPDGKPIVREFGNVKPKLSGHHLQSDSREPLIEVNVDEKEQRVKVVAEMPGASKENISVDATEDSVTISANDGKQYNAVVPVNVKIEPDSAEASYTNGILEIIFKIKGQAPKRGTNIRIK
jgi:HSP20 family protein